MNQSPQLKTTPARAPIAAFWCRIPSRPNFGDALTPWLIRQITGRYPFFVRPEDPRAKVLVSGSIISYAGLGSSVWGAGVMTRSDPISVTARLLAVRGPLTRARALECGAECPAVYGDPGLLLSRFYRPPWRPPHGLGIVPHFSDMPRVAASWKAAENLRLIDIQAPIEAVIDQIASCRLVASSSLHGIIVAHTYGVPAVWLKFRDLPAGDDSKFHDYYLSIGEEPPAPVRLECSRIDPDALEHRSIGPPVAFDHERLWQACPFRGEK